LKIGTWYAAGAFALWGLTPIYWKWIDQVPAMQLFGHRILWSGILLCGAVLLSGQWRSFRAAVRRPGALPMYVASAALIGINWFLYVWGVTAGYIVETSLGYFINPIVSVLIGVVFLGERLRRLQWAAVALFIAGVAYLTWVHGSLPWISLTLAFSFGLYGLVKKKAPLSSLFGLTLETGILMLPAVLYLGYAERAGRGAFLHLGPVSDLLLFGAGAVTTVPLFMFTLAARRIPLSRVGILQYIAPTLQFLLGVLVYGEPFTRVQLIGFTVIWTALAIFGLEGFWFSGRSLPRTDPGRRG
jgi:chloramphenicol-sensitive protein RarD